MPKYTLKGKKIETAANPSETLRPDRVMVNGEVLDRLPRRPEHETGNGECPDCSAEPSGYHTPGCDIERCPACGGKLHRCECEVYL